MVIYAQFINLLTMEQYEFERKNTQRTLNSKSGMRYHIFH